MATRRVRTYGEGGSDPNDPQANVVDERDVEVAPEQLNADSIAGELDDAIAELEDIDARWAALTAAERTEAAHRAVRLVAKLARLLLGRLEAP